MLLKFERFSWFMMVWKSGIEGLLSWDWKEEEQLKILTAGKQRGDYTIAILSCRLRAWKWKEILKKNAVLENKFLQRLLLHHFEQTNLWYKRIRQRRDEKLEKRFLVVTSWSNFLKEICLVLVMVQKRLRLPMLTSNKWVQSRRT